LLGAAGQYNAERDDRRDTARSDNSDHSRPYLGNGASFCVALAGVGDRATFITIARNV
jgi:hypothetical protein